MGPPQEIVIFLKDLEAIDTFIETGTFHGWTSFWASKHFLNVYTIELSKDIYNHNLEKFRNLSNVNFIFGDSRIELKDIVHNLIKPAIFWLDAHWCSFGSYGENDQCPLIDELDIILSSKFCHVILIDDARLFLRPPPLPNSPQFWPSISEIIIKLTERDYYTIVYEDVLISIPNHNKDFFVEYIQQKVTKNYSENIKSLKRKENCLVFKRFIKKVIGYKYWHNG